MRPSNTEPLLRLNLEALSPERMEEKRDEVLALIALGLMDDTLELGRVTDRRPPFKYSALARVWFSDTDAQGIVYYGRYLPYFDHARTEYHRHLHERALRAVRRRSRHARLGVEYHAPARFDDLLEAFVRVRRIGTTSMTYECAAYRLPDDELMVTAELTVVLVDLERGEPIPIPDSVREPCAPSRAPTSRSELRSRDRNPRRRIPVLARGAREGRGAPRGPGGSLPLSPLSL